VADVRAGDQVAEACRGMDTVFHVAGVAGIWGPWGPEKRRRGFSGRRSRLKTWTWTTLGSTARATSRKASLSFASVSRSDDAGPTVAMIFVRGVKACWDIEVWFPCVSQNRVESARRTIAS